MARRVVVEGIRAWDVADAVGDRNVSRGREYVQRGAVIFSEWRERSLEIRAAVSGQKGRLYQTTVSFEPDGQGALLLVDGLCSCPVGILCKHVAAVALSAVSTKTAALHGGRALSVVPRRPAWESALEALLPASASAAPAPAGALGIELAADGSGRLAARLLRPGAKGWVNGGPAWNRIVQAHRAAEHRPDHLALVRELYALHQAATGGYSPYSYSDQRTIDLASVTSERLWPLLDEAAEVGLELRHMGRELGPIERYRRAELSVDVTAGPDDGSLAIRPVLRFRDGTDDGLDADARPVAFIGGAQAHGVVHVAAAEHADPTRARLQLARLDTPVPASVQHEALHNGPVTVPADQVGLFRERFGARLARRRTVISSDGAYRAPEIGPPVLVLRADFGADHLLDLTWQWSYDVGGSDARVVPGSGAQGAEFRDLAAEREVLRGLDDVTVDWDRFGLRAPLSSTLPGQVRLADLDTASFTTEALPALEESDALRVERVGEPADYREVGDELRIGVSTSESGAGNDWFDLGISITVEGREVPFTEVFTALAAGEPHLLRPDGAYFSLEKPELVALRTLIEEARALQDGTPGPLRLSRYQAGFWEELAALGVVERQARAWREQVGGLLGSDALDPAPVPASLHADLRPYQREGFEWLAFLWRHRLGGVLADDMGLGKTVQALALICHERERDPGGGPVLIVAPTSVVPNWTLEAARFAPDLSVVALTDTLKRRGEDLTSAIAGADVVVTSYTLFRLDTEAHERVDWRGVLFDEAQFLKNRQSKVYQCARRVPAPFKLAITGTPMENDLMELWSLLSITAPGLFPSPQRFRETFARPIEKGGDAELLARLRRRVRPLMLRRTKEQVSPELPPKQQQVLAVELTPNHRKLYQRHLQRERQKILGLIDDVEKNRFTILQSITRLRQLSLHPALIGESDTGGSAKIDVLVEQLQDVTAAGHRALVFSQFTGFLTHVRAALDTAGIAYVYLDGTSRSRETIVAGFKDGVAPVFLVSLKAGGFGLNLTEADYCFLLDPWWNPATEAQAVDRTHRIGQDRAVMVYRLIARDTIEEKVRALAQRKEALVAGVIDDGAAFAGTLSADDIRALIS